jgi:molybdenum cofactor biosynthesis enzyme MoaA
MYCGPQWHDDSSKHKSLDELKANWISIYEQSKGRDLKYKIGFTGGEVTGNKAFYPFVKWLRENYSDHIKQILLTTNGSATYNYYLKLFEVVDNISFSTHSEHMDEKKFFATVIKLHATIAKDKFIHVNIMNEFWNTDRIPTYVEILKAHNISHNVNEIEYSYKTRDIPVMKGKLNLEIPAA